MSLTSKQIDELRAYAKDRKGELAELITDAADTIEMLSAKLHTSQMERSSQYYHGGWIPVSERLPEEREIVLICKQKRNHPFIWTRETEQIDIAWRDIEGRSGDIMWVTRGFEWIHDDKVIAWMPLPEPYRGEGEK